MRNRNFVKGLVVVATAFFVTLLGIGSAHAGPVCVLAGYGGVEVHECIYDQW